MRSTKQRTIILVADDSIIAMGEKSTLFILQSQDYLLAHRHRPPSHESVKDLTVGSCCHIEDICSQAPLGSFPALLLAGTLRDTYAGCVIWSAATARSTIWPTLFLDRSEFDVAICLSINFLFCCMHAPSHRLCAPPPGCKFYHAHSHGRLLPTLGS